jgi:membrane-associated phospholipid phosphatase
MRIPRGYASRERHRGGRTVIGTRRPAVVAGIALAVFVVLTVLVWNGSLDGVDDAVWRFGDRHHSDAAVTVARILTDVLQPVVDTVVLLGGAAVLARRRREITPLVVAVVVVVVVSAVVLGLKYAIDRPLPHSLGHGARGFPSGHTAATAGFLGTLAVLVAGGNGLLRRRLLALVAALTAFVVVALVYAGYHWLTDTLASIALSVAVLAALALDRPGRAHLRSVSTARSDR